MCAYNTGRFKEQEFVYWFDTMKIKEMNKDARFILRCIYNELDEEEIVHSNLVGGFKKPDLYVEYKGVRKYISLKYGNPKAIHEEELETFIEFLEQTGVPEEQRKQCRYLFWGDGTYDGTGKRFFGVSNAFIESPDITHSFNEKMNNNNEFIWEVVQRVLFDGRNNEGIVADYLVHYEKDKIPAVINRNQMRNYILSKDWHYKDNPHIGPLQFAPKCVDPKSKSYAYYRKRICFWWARLKDDYSYIAQHYVAWKKRKPDNEK